MDAVVRLRGLHRVSRNPPVKGVSLGLSGCTRSGQVWESTNCLYEMLLDLVSDSSSQRQHRNPQAQSTLRLDRNSVIGGVAGKLPLLCFRLDANS